MICYILFACFISGVAFTALAMGLYGVVKDVDIGEGKTIASEFLKNNITTNGVYTMLAMAIVGCIVGIFLSIYTAQFFKKVIDNKTPFTRPMVKELRKVGLVNVLVNLGAAILIGIGIGIAKGIDKNIGTVANFSGLSIVFGVVLLLISLFIEYPVELEESKQVVEAQPEPQEEENIKE